MTLSAGSRLGPYEIVAPLGAGGMGEVYRARDTRLDRTVAVKILPQHRSTSPEDRQRFEREAKTISQLSHPHICALYDVGREAETEYLVMEYLEGQTLADRLEKGPLPLEQTLRCGIEIADALDKAHRQGIVHRDLKPGNVMLTRSGVKLLDFGLAKAMTPATPTADVTALPTRADLTLEGTILGTLQYMAPEQLEGKEADARTDIFALGAVLYEMATGKKAFTGSSQASLIGAILHTEPAPVSVVDPTCPPALDRIVTTCLAKDPEERWQSAADIRRELRWVDAGSTAGAPARAPRRGALAWLPWGIAGFAMLLAAGVTLQPRRPRADAPYPMLVSIVPPQRTVVTDNFEISPDGRHLAFTGIAAGRSLLRVRDLGSDEVRALSGTENAECPFWSPDGQFLAYYARGKLRRIEVSTSSIETIGDSEVGRGGAWSAQGTILFTPKAVGPIYRVSPSRREFSPATTFEPGDVVHRWPRFLDDGRRFLFFVKTQSVDSTGIYLASLDGPGRKLVLRNGGAGQFLPPDILFFVRGETLLAQHFDPSNGDLRGEPEAVTRPITRSDTNFYEDLFSVSRNSVVVFRRGSVERRLTWLDRRGVALKTVGPVGAIMNMTLSSDNRAAAFTFKEAESDLMRIFTLDLERDLATPFADSAWMPVWTPDGRGILFRNDGNISEMRHKSLGDRTEETLLADTFITPTDVSLDGRFVLFTRAKNQGDVGVLPLTGDRKPQILMQSEYDEREACFAPDGRWLTYTSSESGQFEVFVRRFPLTDEKWQISSEGGLQPTWGRDGKEIFYVDLNRRMMVVPVSARTTLSAQTPQPLFQTFLRLNNISRQYAVSADGQRFLMVLPMRDLESDTFQVLLNWRPTR
jgi:eukaryotic-like serine/threonine-protein kinase